jgi:Mrp family chromosome partitioning ATPase
MNTSGGVEANALRYYAAVLRRRWLWVVLGVVVGVLAGLASTLLVKDERDPNSYFKASHTVIADSVGSESSLTGNLPQAALFIKSTAVTDELASQLGMTSQAVTDQLSANARSDVLALDITAISTDPNQAVALADAGAASLTNYVTSDTAARFEQQRNELTTRIEDLEQESADLVAVINLAPDNATEQRARLQVVGSEITQAQQELTQIPAADQTPGFSTLRPASPIQINSTAYYKRLIENRNSLGAPAVTTAPAEGEVPETDLNVGPPISRTMRILIGGAAGLVMGLAGAFLVEAWDDRIRKRERVESLTGLTVIAEVPRLPKDMAPSDIVVIDAPRSRAAERYRSVRTAVIFALHEHLGTGPKSTEPGIKWSGTRAPVLMVTSPNPSEGKTTTVANLAAVFADGGMRTLVIDCDYRKPAVARYLAPRLTENDGELAETRVDGVLFAPAPRGADSPGAAVGLLRDTIEQWRHHVDLVLLDTPPMLTTNDATDLLAAADAVVLVLRAGQTRAGHAERVAKVVARYRADTLGIVLNSCDEADIDAYYGYYRGYVDDGPADAASEKGRSRRREAVEERPTSATPT